MAKPCARSAFMVRFAELFVAPRCSGNRILSPRREAARLGASRTKRTVALGTARVRAVSAHQSVPGGRTSTRSRGRHALRFANLLAALFALALATVLPCGISAQQVTYYDFNTPQAASSSQTSTSCSANSAASGVLFCFNSAPGSDGLSFIEDNSYTTTIDPNESNGSAYALQLTESAGSQDSSVWYSTPQNVANGFTVWYAVKLTPSSASLAPPAPPLPMASPS